jgi:formylmethanofuran dehydrogenase subunit D
VRRALQRCEFVIVQEAFATTATAAHADLLLPATSWGEKDGTVTNSERRISRVRPAVPAPGQARHDWRIAVDVARRMEALLPVRRIDGRTLFPFDTPEDLWNEHRESTRGRDLDITGMSYAMLDTQGPQQWPLREGQTTGAQRLYADGRFPTADGRAAFAAVSMQPLAEPRDAHYPFSLNTGRLRDHWHGLSRTGTLGRLYGHAGEPGIELHPSDLVRLQLQQGDLVQVQSRRGRLVLPAMASTQVAPAQAFIAMHWGDEVLGGLQRGGVNALTSPAFCTQSKQPELKHAAVKIVKAVLPWQLLARAWLPNHIALQRRAERTARGLVHAGRSAARPGPRRGAALRRPAARPAAQRAPGGARARRTGRRFARHGFPARRRHTSRRMGQHALAGRTAGTELWPCAARRHGDTTQSRAGARRAGLQLLRRRRKRDRRDTCRVQRRRRDASGTAAGPAEVRHELRQLPAGPAPAGAAHAAGSAGGLSATRAFSPRQSGGRGAAPLQVPLEIEMVGNLDEKSLARCAIFTAICRATDL